MVKLSEAVLCEDCQMICAATNGHCPACQSTALMNLAKILNRPSTEESAQGEIAMGIRDAVEEFKQLNKSLSEIAKFLGEEREASRELGDFFKSKGAVNAKG